MTFLCMQKCEITLIFFLFDGRFKKKKETGAVGMKVNNMHEFVKKNKNNAAFVWLVFFPFVTFFSFSMLEQLLKVLRRRNQNR